MSKHHLLAVALALFTAGPVMAEEKHGTDKGTKHEKHEKHDKAAEDDSTEVEIKESEVPAKVAEAFKKAFPGGTVKKVEKETYKDGTVHYKYEFTTADGKKQEVELDTDGEVLPEHDGDAAHEHAPAEKK